ncbi:hypothetical protein RFI_13612, partial [Reticulomyxa filosa]
VSVNISHFTFDLVLPMDQQASELTIEMGLSRLSWKQQWNKDDNDDPQWQCAFHYLPYSNWTEMFCFLRQCTIQWSAALDACFVRCAPDTHIHLHHIRVVGQSDVASLLLSPWSTRTLDLSIAHCDDNDNDNDNGNINSNINGNINININSNDD